MPIIKYKLVSIKHDLIMGMVLGVSAVDHMCSDIKISDFTMYYKYYIHGSDAS